MVRSHIPLNTRWVDMDAYGHVNNVVQLGLVQEARTRFFQLHGPGGETGQPEDGALILITHQEAEYVAQMPYSMQPLDAQVWVISSGGASMTLGFELWDSAGKVLYTRATNSVAMLDPESQRLRKLSAAEREMCEKFADEPVRFRRRKPAP